MQLCRFEIHNFKGIQNAAFDWENIIILIGENNAGKSTVLQALQCFLGGSIVKDEQLFSNKLTDLDHAIELVGHFCELSEPEKQAPAVRGRMLGDRWILKKKFWFETDELGESSWKELYYSRSRPEVLAGWPESEGAWSNFPGEYQALIAQIVPCKLDNTQAHLRKGSSRCKRGIDIQGSYCLRENRQPHS